MKEKDVYRFLSFLILTFSSALLLRYGLGLTRYPDAIMRVGGYALVVLVACFALMYVTELVVEFLGYEKKDDDK